MLDAMFTLKNFLFGIVFGVVLILLGIGLNGEAASSKDQAFALFLLGIGIASLAIGIWDLYKRIKLRYDVRLSPDYEAMEADFAASESFLDGQIFVGKKYLFSVYDGRIFLREDLSNVYLHVSDHIRRGPTVDLKADIPHETGAVMDVVLASYGYSGTKKEEVERLKNALGIPIR